VVLQAWSAESEGTTSAEARTTRLFAMSERPSERGSEPEPQRRRTVQTPTTQPLTSKMSRAVHYLLQCRQLNLKCREKEPFRQLVKNKPRVSQKFSETLFCT